MIEQAIEQLLNGGEIASAIESLVESIRRKRYWRDRRKKKLVSTAMAYKKIRNKLRTGDVIVSGRRRKPRGLAARAYYRVSKRLFKDDKNIHVGMYGGKNRMYDSYMGRGTVRSSLRKHISDRRHFTVLRPKATEEEREFALKFAKKQMGKKFAYRDLLGAGIKEIHPKLPNPLLRDKEDAYTCSSLVAGAYPTLNVKGKKKNRNLVAPKDFRRSRDFREVMRMDRDKDSNEFKVRVKKLFRKKK